MLDAMPHRGPDGTAIRVSGSLGLGHAMLRTTPEAAQEVLPRTNDRGLSITSDARIDNRDDLIRALRLPAPKEAYSDSDLILEALHRWGGRAWDRLEGDFAVAVFDRTHDQLVLACDAFAVKQVYYARGAGFFAFASEIRPLLALPGVSDAIDDEAVVELFVPELADAERTIYRDIRRLLPGHALIVNRDGIRKERYFELRPAPVPGGRSDAWYAEAFNQHFEEAVRCRLRAEHPVGSELSGGLDSSMVTCTAGSILREQAGSRLHTFSNVYDHERPCDERPFIEEVLKEDRFVSHFTVADRISMGDLLPEMFSRIADGRATGNHHLIWFSAKAAAHAGVRVLLTGQDGDSVVGHGLESFSEWARSGDWARFGREAIQYVNVLNAEKPEYARNPRYPVRVDDVVNSFAAEYLIDWARRGRYLSVVRGVWGMHRHLGLRPIPMLSRLMKIRASAPTSTAGVPDACLLNEETLRRYDVRERLEAYAEQRRRESLKSVRERQRTLLASPHVALNLATFAEYGAAWGVEMRHPFMDRRLVQFCLGLPPEQSFRNGQTRAVLRATMIGRVPDRITRRAGKTDLTAAHRHVWLHAEGSERALQAASRGGLDPWVDRSRVETLRHKKAAVTPAELRQLTAAATLGVWLRQQKKENNEVPLRTIRSDAVLMRASERGYRTPVPSQ